MLDQYPYHNYTLYIKQMYLNLIYKIAKTKQILSKITKKINLIII
jgi:hypothetical protein